MAIKFGDKNILSVYRGTKKVNDIIRNGVSYLRQSNKGLFEKSTGMTMLAFVNNGYAESGKAYDSRGQEIPDWDTYWTFSSTSTYPTLKNKSSLTEVPTKIPVIIDGRIITSYNGLFKSCSKLTYVDVRELDLTNITDISGMFWSSSLIETIDGIEDLDVSGIENLENVFQGTAVTELDLSKWDTSNVTNMAKMFSGCKSLTNIVGIENLNVSKVTTMQNMFQNCSSIVDLNLGNWNTSNVTTMYLMFAGCSKMKTLNLSNFNTVNVTDMASMFSNMSVIAELDLTSFDTNNVTTMQSMFQNCSKLKTIYVSSETWKLASNRNYMFTGCGVSSVTKV